MELRQYTAMLWRWLWLLLLCGLCAGSVAYFVNKNMAPVYAASTTLQINPARIGVSSDYNALLSSNLVAKTYAELLRKRPVLEAVVANLALDVTPEDLADRVKISVVRDTQLIQLTVEDLDPQRAADIANEVVAVFSRQNQEQQTGRYTDAKNSLEQEMAQLQLNIDETQASLDRLQPGTTEKLVEQSRLQALLAQYRTSYATLFKSLADVRLAEVQTTDTVAVVEPARAEPEPIRPRTTTNTVLFLVIGVLLAGGVALLIEYLDDTIRSSEEASTLLNTPTLAAIGRIDEREVPDRLVMLGNSARSLNAEAYVSLRVNLEFASVDRPAQTILVTSAGPGEGKSITAANLALAIAQAGRRVILVDTDLRRPSLHKIFGLPNERGVTTALLRQGGDMSDHLLIRKGLSNLYLMPSGPIPPNPSELLGSQRMAALIEALKGEADVVVFDSPPLLAVVDAALLARACDATLLVVLARQTRCSALKRAGEQLAQSGAHLAGILLNKVRAGSGGYGSYYYYRYDAPQRRNGFWRRVSPAARSQSEPLAEIELAQAVAVVETPTDHRRNGTAVRS
ncbi:MAG: polysaccharide biosynthesis tyrosine autokinase [Oscillochloris sp.]|nr:polysaccharide biosynthesis tyrosine autokinase [Oscillochloris sp.]